MNKKYLYMLSAGHLSVDINSGSLPALLPFFVSEYGMDYTSIAGLMFASSFFVLDYSAAVWLAGG